MAGLGWSARVDRFPDPEDSDHLAHVQPVALAPPADLARLAVSIPRRRTDRRRFGDTPVDPVMLDALVARTQLIATITRSVSLQRQQAGYGAELARWTGRYSAAADGIGAGTVASGIDLPGDVPMRHFTRGRPSQPAHSLEHADASVLTVLSARSDDRLGTLRAGEAADAVLLAATGMGLATTPLSQPLDVSGTRDWIAEHLVGSGVFPQLVIRIGWADPQAPALPPTPRRSIDHVLLRKP